VTRRIVSVVVAVVFAAVLISFVVYTEQMGDALRRDAEVFSRMYGNAWQGTTAEDPARVDAALFDILEESRRTRIPIVLTDTAGRPTSAANLPFEYDLDDPASRQRVREYVAQLDANISPHEVPDYGMVVHVGEPLFRGWLQWIPWLQAAVLLVTVGGGGWLVYTSFRGERERIWSAMARESAHQMGTPLSSLVGWLEQLDERAPKGGGGVDLVAEMQADVGRLLKVSRRFELIGRSPSLEPVQVGDVLHRLEDYFRKRLPTLGSSVSFRIDVPADAPAVRGNQTLLEWAFENLIKNSLDALAGREGEISIVYLGETWERAVFRVSDDGPGVAPEVRKRLFEIGVTTKETGWGVGLSLTRRIIDKMHDGVIELEPSEEGASFRVELPIAGTEEGSA
jgi:signal transduction histidine kinase